MDTGTYDNTAHLDVRGVFKDKIEGMDQPRNIKSNENRHQRMEDDLDVSEGAGVASSPTPPLAVRLLKTCCMLMMFTVLVGTALS